jgi:hypothetical protein
MTDLSTTYGFLAAFCHPKMSTYESITDLKPRVDNYYFYTMSKDNETILVTESLLTLARKYLPPTKQKMFDSVFAAFGKPVFSLAPDTSVHFMHHYNRTHH